MLESMPGVIQKDQQNKRDIYAERKRKPDVQSACIKKVRFKLQGEENIDNRQLLTEYLDQNNRQNMGSVEVHSSDTDTERSTVAGLSDGNASDDQMHYFDERHGKLCEVHTTTSTLHSLISSSNISHLGSYVSRVRKTIVDHDSSRPLENVANESEPKQTSVDSATGDRLDCGKCCHCEKWIPCVTMSLHEAVCEGQSQEAKSQDHISLSSLPLDTILIREDVNTEIQNSLVKLVQGEPCTKDTSTNSVTHISDGTIKMTRAHDESCKKKTPGIMKTSCQCTEPDTIGKPSVTSCNSRRGKNVRVEKSRTTKIFFPPEKAQNLSSDSLSKVTKSILQPESEAMLEREESKERCTFCSKFLPVSKLIEHVSECSKLSAWATSDYLENTCKACPYCGEHFEVLELVDHVSLCKDFSRRVAEEISQENDTSSFSSTQEDRSDFIEDLPRVEKDLCPKCEREFLILELVSHTAECKEEEMGSDFESLHGDVDKEDDTGDDEGSYRDNKNFEEAKISDHGCNSNETFSNKKVDIEEKQLSSRCSNDEVTKGGATESKECTSSDKTDYSRRLTNEDSATFGDNYHYNGHERDESEKADVIEKDSTSHENKSDESKIDSNTLRKNSSQDEDKDDDCVGAVVAAEGDVGNDEYEFCPSCRKLFHLSLLIEHASNCTSDDNSETASSGEDCTATDSLTDVPADCIYCGIRLPVAVMSIHFPKCEKQHLRQIKGERLSKSVEDITAPVLPPYSLSCVKPVDKLSGRVSRGVVDPEHQTCSTETKTSEIPETEEFSRIKGVRVDGDADDATNDDNDGNEEDDDDDDKETDESEGVVVSRTTSPLDVNHDCEELCVNCLKMFALNALVEHASVCSGLQQTSLNSVDLEQCYYCLGTFPLNELIDHAPNCEQRAIHCSQEDVTNSQSSGVEPFERCMYCFKDFPVSKLIIHAQKCDGDISGPRERFQGFLPSVHDLSAISSVAILNEAQREALEYVIKCSAQDSKIVASALLARVKRLGYDENDLKRTLQWVRSAAPIIIHINLDRVLNFLLDDTHYRNRFETGTSGGSTDVVARKLWEDRIFNSAYHYSNPSERVKYGVLNIVGDPRGVRSCMHYGDSFLQLRKVRLRTTFASMDTSGEGVKLSCCEHYENVLFAYTDNEITAIMDVATGKVPFHRSDCISQYKEVQIHGPVSLSENIECIVVNSRHRKDPSITNMLDWFLKQNNCNLIWMDPDDSSGPAPFLFDAIGHYSVTESLSGSLSAPPSRRAHGKVRKSCRKRKYTH